ncbi:MAG: hypothetical protein OEX19_16020 [Gammaproteobacteria bacterium]|nr:hypothetical protein [Gammaproteobacteria bacterium]
MLLNACTACCQYINTRVMPECIHPADHYVYHRNLAALWLDQYQLTVVNQPVETDKCDCCLGKSGVYEFFQVKAAAK